MLDFWGRHSRRGAEEWVQPLVETYQAISSASVDALWQRVINLADVSWHPLIARTNVPKGLIPKPGLIYQAVSRLFLPIPIRIFVERVSPRELLSVRILALPGIEERVTYRVESTLCGTRVSYSVTLKGWLSPLIWSFIRPYAARVATELAHAAEQDLERAACPRSSRRALPNMNADLFGLLLLVCSLSPPLHS
ncbi:SRPBCC family protein [Thermoleptolyngbya sp. M55_K2018_002]|uniref:SRPBCC family protein n=1 Tax=Thermoleptolyngbya TaxID=2303528 RepID=UPI0025FD5223|nr:SRPBCC family protein [Thermoleptolyngbya sp. M55_K2018_002]